MADKSRAGSQLDFLDDILEIGGDDQNIVLPGIMTNVDS
jgi:hypothetical protein